MVKKIVIYTILLFSFFIFFTSHSNAESNLFELGVDENGYPFTILLKNTKDVKYVRSADELDKLFRNKEIHFSDHVYDLNFGSSIPVGTVNHKNLKDSDNDDLNDELEIVLGTDTNDPDSDNDGYADGIEVKNNYNPLGKNKITTNENKAKTFLGKPILINANGGKKIAWFVGPDGRRYLVRVYQIQNDSINEDLAEFVPKLFKYPSNRIKDKNLYKKQLIKMRDSKRLLDLKTFQHVFELYHNDYGIYPNKNGNLGSQDFACLNFLGWNKIGCEKPYLGKVPKDPRAGKNYFYEFINKDFYTITAYLEGETDGMFGWIKLTPDGIASLKNK